MYLLDTNVISIVAPQRQRNQQELKLAQWLEEASEKLHLSVVTIAEIETGIARLKRNGADRRADLFAVWLNQILDLYAPRILTLDIQAARLAGRLFDRAIGAGSNASFPDAAIAGTALSNGLTVVTRNTRHFQAFAVRFIDPIAMPV